MRTLGEHPMDIFSKGYGKKAELNLKRAFGAELLLHFLHDILSVQYKAVSL